MGRSRQRPGARHRSLVLFALLAAMPLSGQQDRWEQLSSKARALYQDYKYAEALPLAQQALQVAESTFPADDPHIAVSLNDLGLLYLRQDQEAKAEPLFRRTLAILEKAFGPNDPLVANALNNVATICDRQHKYAEAEVLYRRALAIQEKAQAPDDSNLLRLLTNLGLAEQHQGKLPQAGQHFERALRILERDARAPCPPILGIVPCSLLPKTGDPLLATALDSVAGLRFAQRRPHQAQQYYAHAFALLLQQFQYHFTFMSEKERLTFLATVSYRFPGYFSFVEQFHRQMPALTGDMYNLLLWEKGFIAVSETTLRRQVEASGDPEALKLLDQLAAKRAQIAALINQQPADREAWRQQIEQLEAQADNLEEQLAARSAAFAQHQKLEHATWQQVRDALKPGEAAVEFARFPFFDGKKWTGNTYYVALVVTRETKDHPEYVLLGESKQLEGKSFIQFQQGVEARGGKTAGVVGARTVEPGTQAYDLVWKPLEPLLARKTRIYLSLDGVLNQMPLGLIPAPHGKLLMEKYDLRVVSSTKDLLRAPTAPVSNTAVLIGNPTFDLGPAEYRAALGRLSTAQPPASTEVATLAPTDRSRDQGDDTALPALPGTGAEIQAVDTLLEQRGWQITAYTEDRALEEAVKQVKSPRLLHLATHGFFFADQQIRTDRLGIGGDQVTGLEDPMLRSGLYFAGANRALAGEQTSEDMDDGVLTAYEATSLNLQGTELVVLSACNTGEGDVKNGEGVFGLRRALQEAGAQAVMMSMWSVPDKETQELMTLFYSKWLGGMEKHQALRQAQLEEREVVRKRYGRDLPYYWGAFVLVGR